MAFHLYPPESIKHCPWHRGSSLQISDTETYRHAWAPDYEWSEYREQELFWVFRELTHHCGLSLRGAISRKEWLWAELYWTSMGKEMDERWVRLNVTDLIYSFHLNCVVPQFHVSVEDTHPWHRLESETAGRSWALAKQPSAVPLPMLRVSLIRQIWLQAATTARFL